MKSRHPVGAQIDPAAALASVAGLGMSERIGRLKRDMLAEPRYLSIEQALLITQAYQENEGQPRVLQRARALDRALRGITIRIDPEELIVGNRSPGVRAGIISPEAGVAWVDREIEDLPERDQDRFLVRTEDIETFRRVILPYWRGKSLEDEVERRIGGDLRRMARVVKINQTDHSQGHVCPDTRLWLRLGPRGIGAEAQRLLEGAEDPVKRAFYSSAVITLEAAAVYMERYAELAAGMSRQREYASCQPNLQEVSRVCAALGRRPPESFREAVQSVWFLFAILEMESNASSFSPGRLDQILYPYLERDLDQGRLDLEEALEIVEALWLKFNQIVYLRNSASARYFAGFPIGFNVAVGGKTPDGADGTNALSFLCLQAQRHVGLPQPNLSVRLHAGSPAAFVEECTRVIGLGSGMPQVFNDESIIPALRGIGIEERDAVDYSVVGCVELSTHGNTMGWSDAAMFNMVKALELAVHDGRCTISGEQLGPRTGYLYEHATYEEFQEAYRRQLDFFIGRMIQACDVVDRLHAAILPSPFLSSVVGDCLLKGVDVTAGGARHNLSGIQAIQVANIADSLAAIRKKVYEERSVDPKALVRALETDFRDHEPLRLELVNRVPKYGNDVAWVDELGCGWIDYFAEQLGRHTNARGGAYHTGLYTVSAHVPMGRNVGATPDGRQAGKPLADGGVSAMYGMDRNGPTALLCSVARLDFRKASNGSLLNMKFLPAAFASEQGIRKFASFLRSFVALGIHHVQFNVVRPEDLLAAKKTPEEYRNLVVRVAGYTAYFTELAADLQDEIIARQSYASP